jgi:hypothetical protein
VYVPDLSVDQVAHFSIFWFTSYEVIQTVYYGSCVPTCFARVRKTFPLTRSPHAQFVFSIYYVAQHVYNGNPYRFKQCHTHIQLLLVAVHCQRYTVLTTFATYYFFILRVLCSYNFFTLHVMYICYGVINVCSCVH